MARTDWSQVVYDKQLATAKSVHKKLFVTQKILASELPEYIDAGWEKCKDYKSPKYVGIAKEKPVDEQFEDRIWLMFAGMGFYGLNKLSKENYSVPVDEYSYVKSIYDWLMGILVF